MHLAYCSDIDAFKQDRLRDQQWSYRFPGSGWITCLYRIAAESGITVASGDVAIANVASNKWSAKDVYVIQDMSSTSASALLDLGANPFLITCLEAPLYAPFFYDHISCIAKHFRFSLGFGFSEGQLGAAGKIENIFFRFPSFYLNDIRDIRLWGDRREMVLVAANKYKAERVFVPGKMSLINMLRQLKSAGYQFISPAYRRSLAACLHERRLEAIEYFAVKNYLTLYGSGWGDLNDLPSIWRDRLKDIVSDRYRGLCQDKLDTISNYKFSLCFENMVLPGYVTEKMIDCFVAGTIPVYLGAPDIEDIIPADAFINMINFDSFEQLDVYINSMSAHDARKMVAAGRNYINSAPGMLHGYEEFAKNVIGMATVC